MTYAYRLTIDYPDAWEAGIPDAVQDELDLLPDPYRDVFVNRSVAYNRAQFWKRMGASASAQRSNPITWPAGTA